MSKHRTGGNQNGGLRVGERGNRYGARSPYREAAAELRKQEEEALSQGRRATAMLLGLAAHQAEQQHRVLTGAA